MLIEPGFRAIQAHEIRAGDLNPYKPPALTIDFSRLNQGSKSHFDSDGGSPIRADISPPIYPSF
jgi:hypothetical protein